MASSSSWRRSTRWGGKVMVSATVSRSHPKMRLVVAQHASPLSIFFTDAGSCRCAGS